MSTMFKTAMFITSLMPLWISIIIKDIFAIANNSANPGICQCNVAQNTVVECISIIAILLMFFGATIVVNKGIKNKSEKNTDEKSPTHKIVHTTRESKLSSEFLMAYILPLFAFDFSDVKDIVIFLVYLLILGFLCVRNNNVYVNLWLEIRKYKFYSCTLEKKTDSKVTPFEALVISRTDLCAQRNNSLALKELDSEIYVVID